MERERECPAAEGRAWKVVKECDGCVQRGWPRRHADHIHVDMHPCPEPPGKGMEIREHEHGQACRGRGEMRPDGAVQTVAVQTA